MGNADVVVELEEDTIRACDYVIDLGPGAGPRGGQIVPAGSVADIETSEESLTGQYLKGALQIPIPRSRVQPRGTLNNRARLPEPGSEGLLTLTAARVNNLHNLTVSI